ncbi:MAG: GGDEF domain-containing protein [Lachnospiraceae bacterium]|nr:GGDEF domain-containing protein [Lachnospiraceae bacterium]
MSDILCSKAYRDFFEKLPGDNVSLLDLLQHINRTIGPVARELSIGCLEVFLQAPCTFYDTEGKDEHMTLYEEEVYENTPLVKSYITGEKGTVRMLAYPRKGVVWTVEEEEEVDFLLKNLYFLTGRTRVMELMAHMAVTDHLTNLPNTTGLFRYCGMLLSQGIFTNFTGLFINLKNFKYINQRVGSDAGDAVLQKYAQKIRTLLLPQDFYARLGGDNFFALILNEHLQQFIRSTELISIDIPHGTTIITFDLSTKAGMYALQPGDTVNDLMHKSSLALSAAKSSVTEDFLWYHPSMQEKVIRKKEISNLFPQALTKREFVIYYQPKVCLDDNTLCGAEALVRWIQDGKLIPPMDFIPVLEQEGNICTLDFYVLDTVCRDLRNWLDAGFEPVRTSVNFSKLHLHNRQLSEDVLKVINKYQLDSRYIEIEITETSGYEDFRTLNNFVNNMKEHGICTSLDDFGTGYSSLNLLKDLNVDIIKLDRSFLRNVENQHSADKIIIETIVHMVNELNMQVVAEGVETTDQANYLRSINCHLAQGYLFDKPLPHDEFEKCLTGEKKYDPAL